jgi:hypothetical protein
MSTSVPLAGLFAVMALSCLVGCSTGIRPLESLLQLDGVEISVLRENPFTKPFREAAAKSGSTWSYYGAPPPK